MDKNTNMILKIGDEFEAEYIIDYKLYQNFLVSFRDSNPLHVSRDYAISKGFDDLVMHGNILNGFISNFIGEKLPIKNVIIHKQNIKYFLPCYIDEKLHLKTKITEIHEGLMVVVFSFNFFSNELNIASGQIQIGILS